MVFCSEPFLFLFLSEVVVASKLYLLLTVVSIFGGSSAAVDETVISKTSQGCKKKRTLCFPELNLWLLNVERELSDSLSLVPCWFLFSETEHGLLGSQVGHVPVDQRSEAHQRASNHLLATVPEHLDDHYRVDPIAVLSTLTRPSALTLEGHDGEHHLRTTLDVGEHLLTRGCMSTESESTRHENGIVGRLVHFGIDSFCFRLVDFTPSRREPFYSELKQETTK